MGVELVKLRPGYTETQEPLIKEPGLVWLLGEEDFNCLVPFEPGVDYMACNEKGNQVLNEKGLAFAKDFWEMHNEDARNWIAWYDLQLKKPGIRVSHDKYYVLARSIRARVAASEIKDFRERSIDPEGNKRWNEYIRDSQNSYIAAAHARRVEKMAGHDPDMLDTIAKNIVVLRRLGKITPKLVKSLVGGVLLPFEGYTKKGSEWEEAVNEAYLPDGVKLTHESFDDTDREAERDAAWVDSFLGLWLENELAKGEVQNEMEITQITDNEIVEGEIALVGKGDNSGDRVRVLAAEMNKQGKPIILRPRKVPMKEVWRVLIHNEARGSAEWRNWGLVYSGYYALRDAVRVVGRVWRNLPKAYGLANERLEYEAIRKMANSNNPVVKHLIQYFTGV